MRLLILILLFPFIAQGQIVRTHPYYKPFAASCTPLLLDTYSGAAAAYSLRKLDCDYAGSAIRVRRSSDNTEQDIGFVNGNLDTASLKTFVGTGGTDDGFVVTWYDQSGNANNATQSTANDQPLIMDNGVVIRQNSLPSLLLDGVSDFFNISAISGAFSWSSFFVQKKTASNVHSLWMSSGANSPYTPILYNNGQLYISNTSSSFAFNSSYNNTNFQITTGITNGASSYSVHINGSSISLTSGSASGTNNITLIGKRQNNEVSSVYISEILFYSSDKTSDRAGIESNINTYYSIY